MLSAATKVSMLIAQTLSSASSFVILEQDNVVFAGFVADTYLLRNLDRDILTAVAGYRGIGLTTDVARGRRAVQEGFGSGRAGVVAKANIPLRARKQASPTTSAFQTDRIGRR